LTDLFTVINFLLLCVILVILIIPYAKKRKGDQIIVPDIKSELSDHLKREMETIYSPEPFKYTIPDKPIEQPKPNEVSLFQALNELTENKPVTQPPVVTNPKINRMAKARAARKKRIVKSQVGDNTPSA
jgi:hypothetical protein